MSNRSAPKNPKNNKTPAKAKNKGAAHSSKDDMETVVEGAESWALSEGLTLALQHISKYSPEEIAEKIKSFTLPNTYEPKTCWLCGGCSLDISPFGDNCEEYASWDGLLPWGQGSKCNPRGTCCRQVFEIHG